MSPFRLGIGHFLFFRIELEDNQTGQGGDGRREIDVLEAPVEIILENRLNLGAAVVNGLEIIVPGRVKGAGDGAVQGGHLGLQVRHIRHRGFHGRHGVRHVLPALLRFPHLGREGVDGGLELGVHLLELGHRGHIFQLGQHVRRQAAFGRCRKHIGELHRRWEAAVAQFLQHGRDAFQLGLGLFLSRDGRIHPLDGRVQLFLGGDLFQLSHHTPGHLRQNRRGQHVRRRLAGGDAPHFGDALRKLAHLGRPGFHDPDGRIQLRDLSLQLIQGGHPFQFGHHALGDLPPDGFRDQGGHGHALGKVAPLKGRQHGDGGIQLGLNLFLGRDSLIHAVDSLADAVIAFLHLDDGPLELGAAGIDAGNALLDAPVNIRDDGRCHLSEHGAGKGFGIGRDGGHIARLHKGRQLFRHLHIRIAVHLDFHRLHGREIRQGHIGKLVRHIRITLQGRQLFGDFLHIGQGRDVHLRGQQGHDIRLDAHPRMGDEAHHDGRCDGRPDGADQGHGGDGRIGFTVPGIGQDHVVDGRAHGESDADADEDQADHDGHKIGPGRGDEHQEQRADDGNRKPDGQHRPGPGLIDEPPRNRGADPCEKPQDDDHVTPGARGDAQGVFRELWDEDHPHHHDAADEGNDEADQEVAILEVPQIHHRVIRPGFDQHEDRNQQNKQDQEGIDLGARDRRGQVKEVRIFQSVQQGQNHHREDKDPKYIDFAHRLFLVIGQGEEAGRQNEQRDGDIDIKDELPVLGAEEIQDGAARRSPEDIGDAIDAAHKAQGHPALFRREGGTKLGRGDGQDASATDGLHGPGQDEEGEAAKMFRQAAQQGSAPKEEDAAQIDVFSPKPVCQLPHDGDGGRIGQGVDGDHPDTRLGIHPQAGLDDGPGRSDDPRIDGPHEDSGQVQDHDEHEAAFFFLCHSVWVSSK